MITIERLFQDEHSTASAVLSESGEHICTLLEDGAAGRKPPGTYPFSALRIRPASAKGLPRAAWHVTKDYSADRFSIPDHAAIGDWLAPDGAYVKLMTLVEPSTPCLIKEPLGWNSLPTSNSASTSSSANSRAATPRRGLASTISTLRRRLLGG